MNKSKKESDNQPINESLKTIEEIMQVCQEECRANPAQYTVCITSFTKALQIAGEHSLFDKQIEILYRLLFCRMKFNDISEVDQNLEHVLTLIKQGYKFGLMHRLHSIIARVYWLKSDYEKALSHYFIALDISKDMGDAMQAAGVCLNISSVFRSQSKLDFAVEYVNEAIRGFTQINDAKLIQMAKANLANLYNDMGMHDKALEIKLEAIEYYEATANQYGLALELNAASVIYCNLCKLDKAIEYALKSISIKEGLHDQASLATSWNNLGTFYREYGDYKSALIYFEKALEYFESKGDKGGISMCLNNMGNVYLSLKQYESALSNYQKVLELKEVTGDTRGKAIVLENIGVIHSIHLQNYNAAFDYLVSASECAKDAKDNHLLLSIQLEMIEVMIHQKNIPEAHKLLTGIEEPIIEGKYEKLQAQTLQLYEMLYLAQEDYKNAHSAAKKYNEAMLKYYESENYAKIAEMQTRFETEKKEKEAEIFRLKNVELESRNQQIEQQKAQLMDTLDKLQNSEIRYNFVTEELTRNIRTTFVGKSDVTHRITEMISIVAKSDKTNVLITGETGTGKEIVARNIHACSKRAKSPFYAVNCSAVPDNLFESQFFGHEKDAFTGANATKIGWFEIADKSTLFLDEICSLSLEQQGKLLRVLEERSIIRVGSHREIPVDVRIISAANVNLLDKVNSDQFRRDLYHRLAIFVINIPPLRERKDEIPVLFKHFVGLSSLALNKTINKIEKDIIPYLMDYDFPGNVRELKNIVERAVLVTNSSTLRLEHLMIPGKSDHSSLSSPILPLAEMEKQLIIKALRATGFNKVQAAKLLNVERKVVERKITKYDIVSDDM